MTAAPSIAFTPRVLQILELARREARQLRHNSVGTEHCLLGMMTAGDEVVLGDLVQRSRALLHTSSPPGVAENLDRLQELAMQKNLAGKGVAFTVLQKLGLDVQTVRREVEKEASAKQDQKSNGKLLYTPRVKKVLALAVEYAECLNHSFVGTEDILLALLREGDGSGVRVLKTLSVDIEKTRLCLLKELAPDLAPDAEPQAAALGTVVEIAWVADNATHSFTPRAQQVLALAREEAERFNHNFVGVEHLLLGLIRLGQGIAVRVLQKLGLDLQIVRLAVKEVDGVGPDQKMFGNIPYTPRVKKVLELAAEEATYLNHTYVGTEHILLGILREGNSLAVRIMQDLKADVEKTRQEILNELNPDFASGAEPQAAG